MQEYTVFYTSEYTNSNGVLCKGKVIINFGASDDFAAKQHAEMFLLKPNSSSCQALKIEIFDEEGVIILKKYIVQQTIDSLISY